MDVNLALLFVATQVAGFSVATVAAMMSFAQCSSSRMPSVLPWFFVALAGSELAEFLDILLSAWPQDLRDTLRMVSYAITFFIAPLFLFHVRLITGAQKVTSGRGALLGHFALPLLATVVASSFLLLPPGEREAIYTGVSQDPLSTPARSIATALALLELLIYLQWLAYVAWVVRAQMQHTDRLKQVFASTEGLEVRWVVTLGAGLGFYALLCLVGFVLERTGPGDPVGPNLDSALGLAVMTLLAVWALRQSPGLVGTSAVEAAEEALRAVPHDENGARPKYAKSALAGQQAERIAHKLTLAMQRDRLYRDPNLTLSALATHVGVSTNYVSQTLNEHVGQSFFDFVNGWRIEEAIPLVLSSNQTVLAIAYEVGFNSRSSFYTAFKKRTGCTPSAYKSSQAASRALPV